MPIAPALQRFVDDELKRAETLIERSLVETQALLRDGRVVGAAPADRALQLEVGDRLKRLTAAYQTSFIDSLRSRVQDELSRDQGGRGMAPPSGLGGLSLMNESRVEIDIEISRATQLIDAAAEWELRELQTFTSTLIGQTHVSAESNPLRPMLFATALWDAACAVHPGQAQRAALLRASAAACAPLLKKAWSAASTRLEAQGVTPGAYRSVVIVPAGATGLSKAPAQADAGPAMSRLLAALDAGDGTVRLSPGRVVTPTPNSPNVSAPAPASTVEAALAQLDDTLRQWPATALTATQASDLAVRLQAHREAIGQAAGPGRLRQVVALVGRLFDAVSTDPDLLPGLVGPVARLQVPALRVALADAATLDSPQHPVWLLLDRIGEASATYPQAADPRGAAIVALCGRLVEEMGRQRHIDADLFRKALAKVEQFLAAQMQAQLQAAEAPVQALRDAETLQAMEQQIAQRLAEQMAPLRPNASVRRFLGETWARVLAQAIVRHGEDAEPSRRYIKWVDDVLWSVQLPDHPASRQRLKAMLPDLLATLRAGMVSIAVPDAEQTAVLDELVRLHAAALRRSEGEVAPELARQETPSRADPGTPPATESDMIDLTSLETVPAALLPAEPEAAPREGGARQVALLKPSQRRRMFVHGRWARVQLLWRSERGDFLLFAGEVAGQTHSISRRALERLAMAGLLRPLEEHPLSQRALAVVERRLAVAKRVAD